MRQRYLALYFCAALFLAAPLAAEPVMHKFEIWGKDTTQLQKLFLYWGWTNGFLQGRGQPGLQLAECIEGMSYDQAIAMIDKRYKNHPEWWSRPLGEQILESLTEAGSPCSALHPLDSPNK